MNWKEFARKKLYFDRAKNTYLAIIQYAMIIFLVAERLQFHMGFLTVIEWFVLLGIISAVLIFAVGKFDVDYKNIIGLEQAIYFEQNPEFQELKQDIKKIKKKILNGESK